MSISDQSLAQLPFDKPGEQDSIPARFAFVAQQLPDQPALVVDAETMTYGALNARSGQLAAHLTARFGTKPEPVALLLPNLLWTTIGIYGVLRAGKFYVPLDAGAQPSVLRTTLEFSAATILLTTTELAPLAKAIAASQTHVVAADAPDLEQAGRPPALALTAGAVASVAFTSGSTGLPKGVMWHHGGWLHRSWHGHQSDHVGPRDRVALSRSPTVAAYSSHLFFTTLNGATLCFQPPNLRGFEDLCLWLNSQAITIFFAGGGFQGLASEAPQAPSLTTVRAIPFGGQGVRARDLVGLPEKIRPDCVIYNRLSMSELPCVTNYVVRAEDIRPSADLVPVGYACEGNEIMIWDERGQPLPAGETGQIVIRSRYLSRGYWQDPELTAAKFRPDPEGGDRRLLLTGDWGRLRPDGCLEYLGRKDLMVKIRGYRVEPEAVESVLLAQPGIRDGVVAARPARDGELRLVAYCVPAGDALPTASDLRSRLAQALPSYMLPARFVSLKELPRNASGKVDRQALPPPGPARPALATPWAAPRTDLERQLAEVWADLLELDEVGVDDNFFELGGDSLSAMRMVLEVERLARAPVPADYFRNPTIAALAQLCKAGGAPKAGAPEAGAPRKMTPRGDALARPFRQQLRRLMTGQISANAVLLWLIQYRTLRLPYWQGLRWLAWIGQPAIAGRLFGQERELLTNLAQGLGVPASASVEAFRASVMGNLVWLYFQQAWTNVPRPPGGLIPAMRAAPDRFWRSLGNQVDQASPEERGRLIQFQGLEHLYRAQKAGRGTILLTYHGPVTPIANAILSYYTSLGHIPTLSQEGAVQLAARDLPDAPGSLAGRRAGWSATLTLEGQRLLSQGGVVQIVNDVSYADGNALRRSIGGRAYDLKPGFAELALATGAAVLPVYSAYDTAGGIHMTVWPALEPLVTSAAHSDRVGHLLDQYVAFLETTWRTTPESLGWGALRRYHTCPPVTA